MKQKFKDAKFWSIAAMIVNVVALLVFFYTFDIVYLIYSLFFYTILHDWNQEMNHLILLNEIKKRKKK